MDLRIDVQDDRFVVRSHALPGARATATDLDDAIHRLRALHHLAHRPSPFATVRKRLGERDVVKEAGLTA